MSTYELSKGALKQAFSEDGYDKVQTPLILQITNIKSVDLPNDVKKYRILLNDGVYSTHGLIDEACNEYIKNNNCQRYSIVQVNAFSIFATQKHFFVIKDLEVLSPTSEKSQATLTPLDTYFAEHPNEGHLTLTKKTDNDSPAPATPSVPQTTSFRQEPPAAARKPTGPTPRVSPIETISPYQNNWTIKARVSYKGDLRTWSNSKGEGKVFGVNFLDESDEIKASAFNETAERAYRSLEEGKVYYISKARVQAARKKFNTLSHPYELTLDRDTEITECFDESDVPKLHFTFVKLDKIQNLEANSIVDVIGALKTVYPPFTITAKSTGKEFNRRNIAIVDDTGFNVEIGLWNNTATDFSVEEGTVIAFKGCKVSDFGGKTLSLTQAGSIIPNPGTPESFTLKGWYDNVGINQQFTTLKVDSGSNSENRIAQRVSISQALQEHLGDGDKPDYFSIKASITFCKPENFAYPACTNQVQYGDGSRPPLACNKKLIYQDHDGTWRCEKCDINYNEATYRYILSCSITDSTGQMWLTLFDEHAKKLLDMDATELQRRKEENPELANAIFSSVLFKEFTFRVKAKQDTYNDELKTRYQAVGIYDLNYTSEAEFLSKELEKLLSP
ncbi:Replication factor A protein 1 [Candida viswanathii]|uniref:Replication protein A subunit n=1 Tax=Candida viswanathii TaxID=5486 RepID=A0A367YRV3_9ASCO|nr:Replication factor A protein 1 [Candida viswanathii]